MLKKLLIIVVIVTLLILPFSFSKIKTESKAERVSWWEFQSIDTMKYSRDVSREKLNDPSFDVVINEQVKNIAQTGATHVAIATPYDEEFYPILERWVASARRNNLKVWFRGNWSGWEGWFNYPKISRAEHIKKTQDFIKKHKDIFENGDVFSACPECENGGPGDPRRTGDIAGHRRFLIDEYSVTKSAFRSINKSVASNFNSMNGDVAWVVMDRKTTKAMDGIVTIDHYVEDPEQLSKDVAEISQRSGGRVVLGEFGAPIPDIHGRMSEWEQSEWINEALLMLSETDEVLGINYWTNTGSSSELWEGNGKKRMAADTLKSFYDADVISGKVKDEAGGVIAGAYITIDNRRHFTDSKGRFSFPYLKLQTQTEAQIEATGFYTLEKALNPEQMELIVLKKENEDSWYKIRKFINNLLNFGK